MRSAPSPASPSDDGLIQIDPSPIPSPEDDACGPVGPGGGGTGTPPPTRPLLVGAGVALLAGIVIAVVVLLSAGTQSPLGARPPAGSPSAHPSPTPTVPAFTFPLRVVAVPVTNRDGQRASTEAASSVQVALSSFYAQGFLAPETWTKGVPQNAWDVFDGGVRARAKDDAPSLALGTQAGDLIRLEVTKAGLTVRVLLDASGRPVAADAQVRFQATGTIAGGELVEVTNAASFLLRPESGRWLIVGYPNATTNVSAPVSPSPSAAPTPSSSLGSGSPSAGGSP
jgi:hypothetical protein